MSATKRIPERMCVVCRQMKPKNELIRIVNTIDGVAVDLTGKLNGRGVYICKCRECIAKAQNKSFTRQQGFSIDTVIDRMESLIED